MGAVRALALSSLAGALAACAKNEAKPPLPGGTLRVSSLQAGIQGADSVRPPCPITARFDASIKVFRMAGAVRYRWERTGAPASKEYTLALPDKASTDSVELPLEHDDWPVTDKGVQVTRTAYLRVLAPINMRTPEISVEAKCF